MGGYTLADRRILLNRIKISLTLGSGSDLSESWERYRNLITKEIEKTKTSDNYDPNIKRNFAQQKAIAYSHPEFQKIEIQQVNLNDLSKLLQEETFLIR